jgi:hypothetical protein
MARCSIVHGQEWTSTTIIATRFSAAEPTGVRASREQDRSSHEDATKRISIMLKNVSRVKLAASWLASIAVLFALSVVLGSGLSIGATELWLLACFAPPVMMLFVWRAPMPTVAELLYVVNQPDKGERR